MVHRIRRLLAAGLAAALLAGLTLAGSASAATPITFLVNYGDSCVTVRGPVSSTGTVWVLSPSGTVLASKAVDFGADASQLRCMGVVFEPGMRVRATLGGVTRTWEPPKLSVRVNRATDVLTGIAPASKPVTFRILHRTSFSSFINVAATRTASSTGTYSKDLTSLVNIRGGDVVTVEFHSSVGDRIATGNTAPLIEVWIGRSRFGGLMQEGSGGTVTLRNSAGTFRASGSVAWLPAYDGGVYDSSVFLKDGMTRTVRTGDKVSAAIQSDMHFTVPTLTLAVNTATNLAAGSCPAGKRVGLTVRHSSVPKASDEAVCSAGGAFAFDTTAAYDIVAGDRVEIVVRLSTGDLVARRVVAQ